MKKFLLPITFTTTLTIAFTTQNVYAGQFVLMPNVGKGSIKLDRRMLASDATDTDVSLATLGFVYGYHFDSNIVLAGSSSISSSGDWLDITDRYELKERGLLIGYSFNAGEKMRVVPMLGTTRWRLDTEEGLFISNAGSEGRIQGENTYGKVNLEWVISSVFQLNLSYQYGSYGFGNVGSTRFGFKFEL